MTDNEDVFTLAHVATAKSLGQRLFFGEEPPDWAKVAPGQGNLNLQGWHQDHIMVLVSTTMANENLAISVTIAGMYKVAASEFSGPAQDPQVLDSVDRLPEDARLQLMNQALPELYPFIRELVFRASSEIMPTAGIMLSPGFPQLDRPPADADAPLP